MNYRPRSAFATRIARMPPSKPTTTAAEIPANRNAATVTSAMTTLTSSDIALTLTRDAAMMVLR